MTEQLRQSLSAVIDGEADAFELRRVLDELDRDPELRAAWDRYHLIGSVLRGERTVQSRSAARVLARRVPLAVRESAPAANSADGSGAAAAADVADGRARPAAGRRRAVMGLALAASVVFVTAIVIDPFGSSPAFEARALAGSVPGPGATSTPDVRVAAADPMRSEAPGAPAAVPKLADRGLGRVSEADMRRAQAYMLQHAQHQGLEQRGVISLVKMATYEAP